jgi:molecular chaperone GrpE
MADYGKEQIGKEAKPKDQKQKDQAGNVSSQYQDSIDRESFAEDDETASEFAMDSENDSVLSDSLRAATEEAERYKDMYLRVVAEMDNLKKRSERERTDLLKYGQENILKDFLPIMDSFEKALQGSEDHGLASLPESLKSYLEGMRLVYHQLQDILNRHGLVAVKAEGERFDPTLHQAIQKIEDKLCEQEMVAAVFQKGYLLHGRLLRPAMVSVRVPSST